MTVAVKPIPDYLIELLGWAVRNPRIARVRDAVLEAETNGLARLKVEFVILPRRERAKPRRAKARRR